MEQHYTDATYNGNLPLGAVAKQAANAAASSQARSTIGAVLCYSEYYNGKWQPVRTSDHDNPLTIATFADYSQFQRQACLLWPWMSQDPADGALYLQVLTSIAVPRAPSSPDGGGPGYILYNTHSAPVPSSQLASAAPLAPPQDVRLVVDFWGSLVAGYGTLDPSDPAQSLTNVFWVLHPKVPGLVVEAQPDLRDQWDIPFFFSDSRNAFYVTTSATQVPVFQFDGLMMGDTHLTNTAKVISGMTGAAAPAIPALSTAQVGTPGGAQRALGLNPGLRWVLAEADTVQFNGSRIGFAGGEAAPGKDMAAENTASENTASEETPS
jgi:hypothetical protein